MDDFGIEEFQGDLPFGGASLIAIEIGTSYPEIADPNALALLVTIKNLADIQARALMGVAEPGDKFKSPRLLLTIPKREHLHLMYELFRLDGDAILPWQLVLQDRPKTGYRKLRDEHFKKMHRQETRREAEDRVVYDVTSYRHDHSVSLDTALNAIADGNSYPSGNLLTIKQKVRSHATVRALYMAGIKRAKLSGYAVVRTGLFGPKLKSIPLGKLTQKGRRAK